MARDVLVDLTNILTEVNNGNEPVAKELVKMRAAGVNLYYDEQGFREAVTNNTKPGEGAANQQTLTDLGFRKAPDGSATKRYEFHALNSANGKDAVIQDGAGFQPNPNPKSDQKTVLVDTKAIGNLRDAAIGATAYANDFEVFSVDRTFASPGTRQAQLSSAFTRIVESKKESEAAIRNAADPPIPRNVRVQGGATTYGSGLKIATESLTHFGSQAPNKSTDATLGRRLLGLGPPGTAGRGPGVNPIASATPGFDPEGAHTKAMGGIMALGGLVGWLDERAIEGAKSKDVTEWETYIRSRQPLDPETGFLMVAIIKRWQPRDAAYATRQYVGLEKAEGPTLAAAAAIARRNILPSLPVPTLTVSYEYMQIWYPPLRPRAVVSSADADEKRFGSQHWYPTFQRLRQSLDSPPDYGEALSVLVGSWLLVTLNVLDHLKSYSPRMYEDLKSQLRSIRESLNRARIDIAFRAVEARLSESSFGMETFLRDSQTKDFYDQLPAQSQKEVADWVERGAGAMSHVMQGQWEVAMEDGQKFLYSFKLSGKVHYRNAGSGEIAAEGTWAAADDGVRVSWPKTGTVEHFPAPLKTDGQSVKSITKWGGTISMKAKKVSPYP